MNEMKRVTYRDIVVLEHESIKDIGGGNFDTNLDLYLEGLKDDVYGLEAGDELRHIPIKPMTEKTFNFKPESE